MSISGPTPDPRRFATTIHILVSAVVKLARAERLPAGLALYRGLRGTVALPESFFRGDGSRNGCRGYTEWGFLSSTSSRATAIEVRRASRWAARASRACACACRV